MGKHLEARNTFMGEVIKAPEWAKKIEGVREQIAPSPPPLPPVLMLMLLLPAFVPLGFHRRVCSLMFRFIAFKREKQRGF